MRVLVVRNEKTKKNILYDGMKMYNELPNEIKNIQTINEFKSKCRMYVKQKFELF